ncbi:MAG: YSC84-related protein [bacterium]|nr:YSC84-related protein [bacterium]
MKNAKCLRISACMLALFLLAGCFGPSGYSESEKRKSVQAMRVETLNKLYKIHPDAQGAVKRSVGYGVFTNVGLNLFLVSGAGGWGIVRDNRTGKDTYMNMASAGVGIGLGVKDFRGVFVFTSRSALERFVNHGWSAQGQADAAAKAGEKGGALAGAIEVAPGMKLDQITENGLAIQATIQGTKFWKDSDLN